MALIQMTYLSQALMRTVEVQVILPVDKVQPGRKVGEQKGYKTLYLLHGILGSNIDWVSGTCIQRWAEAKNLAVVMPSGENSFYIDQETGNSAYSRFIGKELPAMMRKTFPLSDKREDTFIGGLSMGGYGALHNGLKYCDTFSHIASLSGAVHMFKEKNAGILRELACFGDLEKAAQTDKNPQVAFMEAKRKDSLPKIYMSCGLQDGLLTANRELKTFFEENGADITYVEADGGHEWDFWNSQIHEVLEWLPLGESSLGMSSGHVVGIVD